MPPKRRRNLIVGPHGPPSSGKLTYGSLSPRWGWVGSEVQDVDHITLEHRMAASNLSIRNGNPFCQNKYTVDGQKIHVQNSKVNGELNEDVIVVSDADEPICAKRSCKANPYCLNYLGQELWEDEDVAWDKFAELTKLGEDPGLLSREVDLPVGLKNLGATCYANASLQVWFRFAAFRAGVYACVPPDNMSEEKYKESPLSQLQVTFAALQDGNGKVFNPMKLVESLQLRTSEQQDAQEFSKLFMTHLDAEFKKQNSASLKTLITNQFQGTQVYGTMCKSCKYRSETRSEFLEIEVGIKNNARLEDCISTSLLPETLSGENQYLCASCMTLHDATRYTELQKLPPVLHFSLMRFVYDLNTMERKKSKNSISFPLYLDMSRFLGSPDDRRQASSSTNDDNDYELRGILLHKGASAYHGHYEAQVYDEQHGSWFLFNDEHVTKINDLGDKISQKQDQRVEMDEKPDHLEVQRNRTYSRKRRRIEDSDDGGDVNETKKSCSTHSESIITSRDAYMLIYARKDSSLALSDCGKSAVFQEPEPPHGALKVVRTFNDEHTAACKAYLLKENALKARFADLRRNVRTIYRNWNLTFDTDCVVVSRLALEAWLSTHCIAAAKKQCTDSGHLLSDEHDKNSIDCTDIICEHGLLDPLQSHDMKCITLDAYHRIVADTNCDFLPAFQPTHICSECVSFEFQEKLYHIDHPRFVKSVEEVFDVPENEFGYWISKKWYKDWRLIKPKMHVACKEDPDPDSGDFRNHVYCEHGGLTLNITNRRKLSTEALNLLKRLFPSWKPLPTDIEPCAVCEAEISLSREDKREVRKRVEDEKARLRFLWEPTLDSWTKRNDERSYAVLSAQFVRDWRRWICNPVEHQRPERIDNSYFFCLHDLLAIDVNCPGDLDSTIVIIQRDEWNVLNSIYEGGPLISLSKAGTETGGYRQDTPICQDCRVRRRTEWNTADIVIRHVDSGAISRNIPILTYGRANGSRQSERLRQIKEGKRRHITVNKLSTVKEIKAMVLERFSIPPICQRLFLRGEELQVNTATVESLQILANETIDLRETDEVDLTSDSDGPSQKQKMEENGFRGTLLGSADVPWSSSPEQTQHHQSELKQCSVCTFNNPPAALLCEVCFKHLA